MKPNIISITILIPAHNEEANIVNLLESITKQNISNIYIEEIIVLCDGCTDNTAELASNFSHTHTNVHVLDDGRRLGKHRRLINAFKKIKSSIAIVFDGDILLSHPNVLHELSNPFANTNVSLVGGNNIPVADYGLDNYLINAWTMFWFRFKQHVRNGNNIHNVRSCALAIRMTLIRRATWPKELQSHGQFLYLQTLHNKMRFVFAHDAIVWYRNPTTFADYAIQKKRGIGKYKQFAKQFGSWIKQEYEISFIEKMTTVIALFLRNPIESSVAMISRLYIWLYFISKSDSARGHYWKVAQTTKSGISMNLFKNNSHFFKY